MQFFKGYILAIFFIISSIFCFTSDAQDLTKEDKLLFKTAIKIFNDEDFIPAKVILDSLIKKYPENFEVNYYLGACYLNTRYQKAKAIPYLKKAVNQAESAIPSIVHKDLGDLYHQLYDFDKAIYHYKRFLKLASINDEYRHQCKRMIEVCYNAKEIIKDTLNLNIKNVLSPINTDDSEFAPYVSTDDSMMFFSRVKFFDEENLLLTNDLDTMSHLYVSFKKNNQWGQPILMELSGIDDLHGISMAGMSPGGEYIYINGQTNGQQDIFVGKYNNNNKIQLERMPEPINSPYWEGKISITPDNQTMWFSSDRPSGYGGRDLYISKQLPDGKWSTPVNAGPSINTIYDEDAPFIHPSGTILYFSSKGHNTMGGYDIFSVLLNKKIDMIPENMGIPINTTGDDIYFVLTANGNVGYFSSSFGNIYGNYDIYRVKMNLNIPLTLVKGTIKAGDPPLPIGAQIKVFNNETGQRIPYAYDANPYSGRFLMIFPPGKNYDIIIEAQGYTRKSVNVYIPNQSSFYELYQNIFLSDIETLGAKIGEKLQVENIFFETGFDSVPAKDYSQLYNLINAIVESTDSIERKKLEQNELKKIETPTAPGDSYNSIFEMIDEAFVLGDTSKLNAIQDQTITPDKYQQVVFNSKDSIKAPLTQKIYGQDTIYTSQPLYAFGYIPREPLLDNDLIERKSEPVQLTLQTIKKPEAIKVNAFMLREAKPEERKIITETEMYFDPNATIPNRDYSQEIDQLAALLVNNGFLGIVITGYTDTKGTPEANQTLAQARVLSILKIFSTLGVDPKRAVTIINGEKNIKIEKDEQEMAKNRRVEIQIFELIK